jgi:hypothetical protein
MTSASASPPLVITTFRNLAASAKHEEVISFDDLVERIADPKGYPGKKSLPLIKLARFGSTKSEKGSLRHDANVLAVSGLEGDHDAGKMQLEEAAARLQDANLEAVLYTSPSHTPAAPRWRVLLPLSRECAPEARAPMVKAVDAVLGNNVLAAESYTLSQSYYIGQVRGAPYSWARTHGDRIDDRPELVTTAAKHRAPPATRALRLDDVHVDGVRSPAMPDEEVLERLYASASGEKARRLLERGDITGYRSESEADLAAANLLVFYTQDPAQVVRLLQGSALSREKYARGDYLARTVQRALDGKAERYSGSVASPARSEMPAPVDIFRTIIAPPLDPKLFPEVLRDFAVPRALAAGHDPAAYLMAGLAAAASATPDTVRLAVVPKTDYYESPRIWVLLVGSSGAAKSPALRAATASLWEIHRQLHESYEAAVADLPEDAKRPPRPALLSTDSTIESLCDVLRDNPNGITALYEEIDSWLGSHDAYRGGQGSKDRGEWLRLFDGGPHQVNRVKRGPTFVPNWGASILAATTPAGLRRHAKDLPADGLIQRFMPVIVSRTTEGDDNVDEAVIRAGGRRFGERLAALHRTHQGVVRMEPEAAALFLERRGEIREEIDAIEAVCEPMGGHVAKQAAMVARVALTMHMLEFGPTGLDVRLGPRTMQAAIGLLRALTRHALSMFTGLSSSDSSLPLAQAAGRTIVAGSMTMVSRRDLIHNCRAFRDANEAVREAALRFLVDAAWLTPLEDGRQYRGRPAVYLVHRDVATLFTSEGKALLQRRRAVRELLAG